MYYNTTEKTPMKKPMKMKDGDDVKDKVKKRKEMMERQNKARATEMSGAKLQGMGMMYGGMVKKKMEMGGMVGGMMHSKIAKATKPCVSLKGSKIY